MGTIWKLVVKELKKKESLYAAYIYCLPHCNEHDIIFYHQRHQRGVSKETV